MELESSAILSYLPLSPLPFAGLFLGSTTCHPLPLRLQPVASVVFLPRVFNDGNILELAADLTSGTQLSASGLVGGFAGLLLEPNMAQVAAAQSHCAAGGTGDLDPDPGEAS